MFVKHKIIKRIELTMLYLMNDVILNTDILQNYIKTSKSAYGIHPFFCSTPSFT